MFSSQSLYPDYDKLLKLRRFDYEVYTSFSSLAMHVTGRCIAELR